ncbi:hypothetical protein V8D89_004138, partial [Ganoderma adspersum]
MSTQSKLKDPRAKGRAIGQAIVSLFDKTAIHNEAAVDIAIANLDHLFGDTGFDVNQVVEAINTVPHLLEFILSVSSDYAFELLSSAIMKNQPQTAEEFLPSVVYKLLAQFSVSLCLRYQRVSDTPPVLVVYKQSVPLAFSVLKAISLLDLGETPTEESVDVSGTRWAAKSKEKQAQKRKRSIHASRAPAIDVKSILEYGARVPTSKREAAALAETVIAEQMAILRVRIYAGFFDVFRKEETAAFFKSVYLPPPPPPLAVTIPAERRGSVSSPMSPIVPLSYAPRSAFPLVQPMKAALYFDNAQGFGPWRIQMSGRADRDLRQWSNKDAEIFEIIITKIKDLSKGNFTKDNHKKLTGGDVDVPIYEAKMTKNTRLVYQIHCDVDFEDSVRFEFIRIFGVYTHAEIDQRFWDAMSRHLNGRGPEYRKRCIFRNKESHQRGQSIVLPGDFPVRSDSEQEVETSPSTVPTGLSKEDMESLHSLLTLEKFVTFSQAFLNSILADQDVSHVFGVSHREKEIIEHDSSCYVIGRSGTGKTTTMVFKILGIERTYDTGSFRGALAKPRQLFVTQSQVLAKKVEDYYSKLYQSHATAHLSPVQLKEMASRKRARRERMVDEDEEIFYTSTLPRRYGALEDSHFPLFLTYNHLCRLLEGEFRYLVEQEKVDANKASLLRDIMKLRPRPTRFQTGRYLQDERDSFLDYETFLEVYWSHFPENSLNPDLVWGEFMAVIKGSAGALRSETGHLDKETYLGLGRRRTQTSSLTQRETVYKLFEVYMRRKREHGHYDPADRTRMLIRSLKAAGVPGKALNFVYVDEAQDNFLIDSLGIVASVSCFYGRTRHWEVLKALCSNPHGLFWAGDTAQTIAAGSSFRFKDLKSAMYHSEEDSPTLGGSRARPETFYLTTNYRSHAGIVNCADSVVQLITEYWPDAIDRLPQEKGMSPGTKPLVFSDQNAAKLQRSLFRDSAGGGAIEFGARQCILVRDSAARQRLKDEFGKIGQVLTVYESKGLEFDDVLLYNFFEDSKVEYSQWRVLLNSVPGCEAPAFDDGRHGGVCRELKNLYVAVTRARQNLWITDCSEKAHPLRRIWADRELVEEHRRDMPMPTLAVSSGKEEWADAARSLFVKRQYSEAVDAFERANRPQERLVALAYSLREEARASFANTRGVVSSQSSAFVRAAEAFIDAVHGAPEPEDRRTYYRIAAECYVRGGNDGKAGAAYRDAAEYTLAAKHLRKAGMFDEAVAVVQFHGQDIPPDVVQSIVDVSKLYYIRENELDKARALFQNDDEALEYMDDRDLNAPLASLHEQRGEYDDAAECHLREGDNLKAIELFLLNHRHNDSSHSLLKAAGCVLDGFWLYLSLGAPEDNWSDQTVITLAAHAENLQHRLPNDTLREEMAMFRAIAQNDIPALASLGESFHSQDNFPATLLCLDRVFAHDFSLDSAESLSEIVAYLKTFLVYARILQRFSCAPDPCANQHLQRLFAFRKVTEDNEELFLVPKECYLYARIQCNGPVEVEDGAKGIHVPRWDLERLIKAELRERLKDRVWNENEMCHRLPRLRPCLLFAVSGFCPRRECPQRHSPESEACSAYNSLVRVYVLQIMIFHTLYAAEIKYHDLVQQQRAWLRRLYEALYPKHHTIGSLHVLSLESVPELTQGRQIIAVWIQDFLNRLYPDRGIAHAFLVNLMRTTRLAMLLDRRIASSSLRSIPCAFRFHDKRPQGFLRSGTAYIVHDLLAATQGSHRGALDRAVLFMNHVVYNRLRVDIGVLCDFMDDLCGSMLISLYLKLKRTLNGLTLPKSWLVRILQDGKQLARMRTDKSEKYTACMGRLLGTVYTGNNAAHLLFENLDLSSPGLNKIRVVFFTRLCQNLCFWGFNIHVPALQEGIHKLISSIKNIGRSVASPMASAYIYAKDWETLMLTALGSVADSPLDEVIQLYHAPKPRPKKALPNVRPVVYSSTEDILSLLDATHIAKLSYLENDSKAIGMNTASSSDTAFGCRADLDGEGRAAKAEDLDNEDDDESEPPRVDFTEEHTAAASKIISVYRKYILRKASEKDQLDEMRRRIRRDFLAKSRTVEWQGSPYRFLFRRVLPPLFSATEGLKDRLYGAKSAAKESLLKAHDRELESVQAALDDASRLFKEACRLHKALAPSASVHRARDVNSLQRLAMAVESLAEQVENVILQDESLPWTADLDMFRL